MQYLVFPDGITVDSAEKAARSVQEPWSWLLLKHEVTKLSPGDEIVINANTSIIALSGVTKEFKA